MIRYNQSVYEENANADKKIILLDRKLLIRIAELKDLEKFLHN